MSTIFETLKTEQGEDGVIYLIITEGEFTGVKFSIGKVWFPNADEPVMSFNYDLAPPIPDLTPLQLQKMEYVVGDIVTKLLQKAMEEETLIYKGGTDENRRTDIVEPSDERNIFSEGPAVPGD